MAIKIKCIKKENGNHENPCEAISSLGWIDDLTQKSGSSCRIQMYEFVKEGGYAYVEKNNSRVKLITAISSKGNKYVKTNPNDTEDDNLLKLSKCN
jgi:hypothetical protein